MRRSRPQCTRRKPVVRLALHSRRISGLHGSARRNGWRPLGAPQRSGRARLPLRHVYATCARALCRCDAVQRSSVALKNPYDRAEKAERDDPRHEHGSEPRRDFADHPSSTANSDDLPRAVGRLRSSDPDVSSDATVGEHVCNRRDRSNAFASPICSAFGKWRLVHRATNNSRPARIDYLCVFHNDLRCRYGAAFVSN